MNPGIREASVGILLKPHQSEDEGKLLHSKNFKASPIDRKLVALVINYLQQHKTLYMDITRWSTPKLD